MAKSKRSRRRARGKQSTITKAATTREQRRSVSPSATPAIYNVQRIVDLLRPWELSPTERFKTYQKMLMDEAVWSSVESRITSIETSQNNFKLKFDKNSERSTYLKKFVEYNLKGMKQSIRQVARDCAEMIYNGISLHEINCKIENNPNEYQGMFVLDKLTYIDPLTLDMVNPYETKNDGRELQVWRQKKQAFADRENISFSTIQNHMLSTVGAVEVDARKVGVCAYNASSSRPLGTSPLDAAYTSWREKNLIQEYLLVGIQKDLAGTPVLRVPQDLFDQAGDPNSDAARTLEQLRTHMANLHAGDQTYMILPSDGFAENGSGNLMYDVTFKGIDGRQKSFELVDIIEQKKKAIYNVLSASHLITGENGGGSYNLLEGKAGIQAHASERDNLIIDDMINKTIIPILLRLNGFTNEKISDIPVYKHGAAQPLSLDETSKALQRTGAVGLLPSKDPVFLNEMYEKMGFEYRFDEDGDKEEMMEKLGENTSRSGDGMTQGMSNGTGDATSGGDTSTTNSENSA